MNSDCYLLLGVARDANPSQIRRAYRARVRDRDPDRAGTVDESEFLALNDAYDTLRDPGRRSDHDRQLLAREALPATGPRHEFPIMPAMDLFGAFDQYRPSRPALLRAFLDNYTGRLPKSHPVHALNVEVVLSPDSASRGGVVPFDVPVARPCHRCDGTGDTGFFHCDACEGHGVSWSVARVDVVVPRAVRDGTAIPVSMKHLGVQTMFLNLQIRVAPGSVD